MNQTEPGCCQMTAQTNRAIVPSTMSTWAFVLPHRTWPTTRTWEFPDTFSQYEFRLPGDLTGGSQVCIPLDYEPDVKNTAPSDSQQEPGAQVSKHDLKTYTILLPKSIKGKMPEPLNLKSCHQGLFPLWERKPNPDWRNGKKKAAVAPTSTQCAAKSVAWRFHPPSLCRLGDGRRVSKARPSPCSAPTCSSFSGDCAPGVPALRSERALLPTDLPPGQPTWFSPKPSGVGSKRGALGSELGFLISGCFLRWIGPVRLYPLLGTKPAEGHVLLHTFRLPAHVHAATPGRAAPRYLLCCRILPQSTEKPFLVTLHCNPVLISSGPAVGEAGGMAGALGHTAERIYCPFCPFPDVTFSLWHYTKSQWGLTTPV